MQMHGLRRGGGWPVYSVGNALLSRPQLVAQPLEGSQLLIRERAADVLPDRRDMLGTDPLLHGRALRGELDDGPTAVFRVWHARDEAVGRHPPDEPAPPPR